MPLQSLTMAVLKLKFCRNPSPRRRAKAHIRYISHRPDRENVRKTRELFSADGAKDKAYAYQFIDEAPKGTRFFKLMYSPDPFREDACRDLPMKTLFQKMMLTLERQLGRKIEYVAALHDDHTDARHIHSLIACKGKIGKEDLALIKRFATEASRRERRARDIGRRFPVVAIVKRSSPILVADVSRPARGGRPSRIQPCPNCLSLMEAGQRRCSSCGRDRREPMNRSDLVRRTSAHRWLGRGRE